MTLRCNVVFLCAAFLAAGAFSQTANAQVLYGSVVGLAEDPSGGGVPGATVTITNKATGQTHEAKTNGEGRYLIGNVLPGQYDLKITANGFRTQTKTDLRVEANTVSRGDLKLEVGSLTEQVTVQAEATLLQTDKSDTHSTITGNQIVNLALPAYRNYQSLMNLVPGATPTTFQNSATDTPNRALSSHINGTNRNSNNTRIDKPVSIYNNYGLTLGGPVVKNKLFFFGSWDVTRQRQGAVSRYSVPANDLRGGDFSRVSTLIYDPNTGNPDGTGRTPFAGNRIPANRLSPISQKLIGFYPQANLAGDVNNYFASGVPRFDRDYVDAKMNYNRNE